MVQIYLENVLKMKLILLVPFLAFASVTVAQRNKELSELTKIYGKNFVAKEVTSDTCKFFYFGILLHVDKNGKVQKFEMTDDVQQTVVEIKRVTSIVTMRWKATSFKNKTLFLPLKINYSYEGQACRAQTSYQMDVCRKYKKPIDAILIPEIEITYAMDIRR